MVDGVEHIKGDITERSQCVQKAVTKVCYAIICVCYSFY
jgi:hypothetical protein